MNNLPSINTTSTSFAPIILTPETAPLSCARQLILERVCEMVRFEEGTRKGDDIEALHDMRVWSRRLREAFEIFILCIPSDVYKNLYRRAKLVTKTLGQARNADVAVDFFSKRFEATEKVQERFALEDLLRQLVTVQTVERKKMQHKLDKKVRPSEFPKKIDSVFRTLAEKPPKRQRGPRTALSLTKSLLAQRLKDVFIIKQMITGEENIEGLHNLRIAVKKLRYAMEVMHFTAGKNTDENLKFFKKLQTILGDIHDCDVFTSVVRQRYEELQQQRFTSQLLLGYEKIFHHLTTERHKNYVKYDKIFGASRLTQWQRRISPGSKTVDPKPNTVKTQ